MQSDERKRERDTSVSWFACQMAAVPGGVGQAGVWATICFPQCISRELGAAGS